MARAGIQGGRGGKGRGGPPQQQQRAGGGGGQPNMQQLMALQQQLMEAQERIAQSEVQAEAGNGLVTATVTGSGELLGLTVKPEVVDPEDVDTLVDLVVFAVQAAQKKASELQAEAMGPLSGGLPGLPF